MRFNSFFFFKVLLLGLVVFATTNFAQAAETKVEVKQSTPEEAYASLCKAIVAGDYDSQYLLSDEIARMQMAREAILGLAMAQLPKNKTESEKELARRKALFEKYGVRDFSEYAGKQIQMFSVQDQQSFDAIPDKLACAKEFNAARGADPALKMYRQLTGSVTVLSSEPHDPYVILKVGLPGQPKSQATRVIMEKGPDGWFLSVQGLRNILKEEDQQKKTEIVKMKPVELKNSTPEEVVETYRAAIINNDWKTQYATLTEDSQWGVLGGAFADVEEASFTGRDRTDIEAKRKTQRELLKKYGVTTQLNSNLRNHKSLQDPAARVTIYNELRLWVVQNNDGDEQADFLKKHPLTLDSKKIEGDKAILIYMGVKVKRFDGKDRVEFPVYVAVKKGDQWFLDLSEARKIRAGLLDKAEDEQEKLITTGVKLRKIIELKKTIADNEEGITISNIAFATDNARVLIGGDYQPIQVVNLESGEAEFTLPFDRIPYSPEYLQERQESVKYRKEHNLERIKRKIAPNPELPPIRPRLAWSPDGKQFFVALDGKAGQLFHGIYSIDAQKLVQQFPLPENDYEELRWLANNTIWSVSDGSQRKVSFASDANPKQQTSFNIKSRSLDEFQVSPDGKWVAAYTDKQLRLYSPDGEYTVLVDEVRWQIDAIAFSPDSKQLAYATTNELEVINLASKRNTKLLDRVDGRISNLIYSADGSVLTVVGNTGVQILNATNGKVLAHGGAVHSISALSPDGKTLVSDDHGKLKVWDITVPPAALAAAKQDFASAAASAPPPEPTNTTKPLITLRHKFSLPDNRSSAPSERATISSVSFSPDGKQLVLGPRFYEPEVWSTEKPQRLTVLKTPGVEQLDDTLVTWSPDGSTIAVLQASELKPLFFGLYSGSTKRPLKQLPLPEQPLFRLKWNGIDRLAGMANGFEKGRLSLVTISKLKVNYDLRLDSKDIKATAVSPDGSRTAMADEVGLRMYDATGKELHRNDFKDYDEITAMEFSPDGSALALAHRTKVSLLNPQSFEIQELCQVRAWASGIHYTPDASKLVLVDQMNEITVIDVAEKKVLHKLEKGGNVHALSPTGKVLATVDDGHVSIWDLNYELGEPIKPIPLAKEFTAAKAPPVKPATPAPNIKVEPPIQAAPGPRTWTSADGMFKIEAEFVQQKSGFVQLKRKDTGALVSISIEKLSQADQEFLKTLP